MISAYPRFQIMDCYISRMDMERALDVVRANIENKEGGYVCFSNVHTVVESRSNKILRGSINNSFLSLPDGRPLSLYAKLMGLHDVSQVAGPDFMWRCLQDMSGTRHFFYGSTVETLEKLTAKIAQDCSSVVISGMYSPPYRELTEKEQGDVIKMLCASRSDFIWVGLGAPKQEQWMVSNCEVLRPSLLLGVGAAFDFYAGQVKRCPPWLRKLSLEWLYRLYQEPRRLWKRYIITNSLFIFFASIDFVKRKLNLFAR